MAFTPGRLQPQYTQQGNPLGPGPDMRHPATNPSGLLPAPTIPRSPEAWSDSQGCRFVSTGTDQVWLWESPVFDLRPGVSAAYGQIPSAVPINHEAALGQGIYMVVLIGESSGTTPPASTNGIRVEYFENGNGCQAGSPQLMRLTQDIDITEVVLAGGVRNAVPFVASPVSFTPCVVALRFWQVSIRVIIPGVAPITLPYFLQASLH